MNARRHANAHNRADERGHVNVIGNAIQQGETHEYWIPIAVESNQSMA